MLLTPQIADVDGLVLTFDDADAGDSGAEGHDTYLNTGREVLQVANASGGPITVTINAERFCLYGVKHNKQVTVDDSTTAILGPYRPDFYADGDTGITTVVYSDNTDVTVALFKVAA